MMCDYLCWTGSAPHQDEMQRENSGFSKHLLPKTAILKPHRKDAVLGLSLIYVHDSIQAVLAAVWQQHTAGSDAEGRENRPGKTSTGVLSFKKTIEYPAVSSNRNGARSYPTDKKPATRVEAGMIFGFGFWGVC